MHSKKKHINNTAYNGFENNFSSQNEILYRKSKLHDVEKNVQRVKTLFNKKINVLDVGAGNSKFLYSLHQHNFLEQGYGIEVSSTRSAFAKKWAADLNIKNVINLNINFFDLNLDTLPSFDLIYCSDLVFQFFEPTGNLYDSVFLDKAYKKLNPGGKIIIELDTHDTILNNTNNGKLNTWQEFNRPDPWMYMLWDCSLKNSQITINKTFIKRDLSDMSKSTVILKLYSRNESIELLKNHGFKNIDLFEFWNSPNDTSNDEFILIGNKK